MIRILSIKTIYVHGTSKYSSIQQSDTNQNAKMVSVLRMHMWLYIFKRSFLNRFTLNDICKITKSILCRKRYEEIGSQQRMCEFLKRSFSKDSKEYAKVMKISSKLNIEKEQVSRFLSSDLETQF